MTQHQITLYLTAQGAHEAATKAYRSDPTIHNFRILQGTAKWGDGTKDHGFKVRLDRKDGNTSYL